MKKNDKGLEELLGLLKSHPELIKDLVFDSASVKRLLKGAAAQQLSLGVNTQKFLKYISGPVGGYPIAQCLRGTQTLCAKGTAVGACLRGTRVSACLRGTAHIV
jgi:hypothetical protein